jgi:hypothetical protein
MSEEDGCRPTKNETFFSKYRSLNYHKLVRYPSWKSTHFSAENVLAAQQQGAAAREAVAERELAAASAMRRQGAATGAGGQDTYKIL